MNKEIKKLLIITLILIVIKVLFSLLVSTPTIYSDEFIYIKNAQSFFQNMEISLNGLKTAIYPPLYSILLSLSFIFQNVNIAYILMKIINTILSTLIIIPTYLLTKEFLDKKKSLIVAGIIGILPMIMVFTPFIMSENLFYTLYLTSIYFIYKTLTKKENKYSILAGISIGLTYLTKFAGISLVAIVILILIYKIYKKEYSYIKFAIIMGLVSLVVISPWIIRNGLTFGFTLSGLLGQYANEAPSQASSIYSIIIWFFIDLGYLILASGIIPIFFILSNLKKNLKDKKIRILAILTLISVLVILAGSAQHGKSAIKENTDIQDLSGRIIGRYLDTTIPILIIFSLILFYKNKDNNKSKKLLSLILIPFILLSSQLLYFSLFPANNISLALIGSANLVLSTIINLKISIIIITLILLSTLILINKIKLNSKKIIYLLITLFIITSILGYASTTYNSKKSWENNPQIKLSEWISKNIDKNSRILIDEDYCGTFNKNSEVLCTTGQSTELTALWIMNPISINNINTTKTDYIITKKELNLKLIKETNRIKLYKT